MEGMRYVEGIGIVYYRIDEDGKETYKMIT